MIGNVVPVKFAEAIAKQIKKDIHTFIKKGGLYNPVRGTHYHSATID